MYAFLSQRDRRTTRPFARVTRVTRTTLIFLQQLGRPNIVTGDVRHIIIHI